MPNFWRLVVGVLFVVSMTFASVMTAKADPVAIGSLEVIGTRSLQGNGFGVVLPVLSLHANDHEQGGVGWNGSADFFYHDDNNTGANTDVVEGSPHSQTYTFAALIAGGINNAANLGIIYNVNEQGSNTQINLNNVSLRVYNVATGAWVFQTGLCSGSIPGAQCPGNMPVTNQGQGGDGYLFHLDAAAQAALAQYFANPTQYRVGLFGNAGNPTSPSDDGADDFYFTTVQPVPEPSSILLLGSGLVGITSGLRRRYWRNSK